MLIGTMHCMVDSSLSERFEPYALCFGQSLRTDADDKFAVGALCWHPASGDDIGQYQHNR
ncbi:MAG: hypothetical protein CL804_02180 [Citromicrobium sp.]|nr:hypothetical protein [Citromicrobium sp.]